MRRRAGLVVAAALLCACGEPAPPPPTGPLLEFRLAPRTRLPSSQAIPEPAAPDLREVVRSLERIVKDLAGPSARVEAKGTDRVLVRLPEGADADEVAAALTLTGGLGNVQFRILVDPEHVGEDQAKSLWDGTVEEFEQYREEEVAEWKKARDQATAYKPTKNPKYRVVRRSGTETERPEDFVVVVEPETKDSDRFGGEILTNVRKAYDGHGMPAVAFDIKEEYRIAFGDWTEKHLKQPMAMLLNDEFDQAPLLQSRLTESVHIPLGGSDVGSARARQRKLIALLGSTSALGVRLERIGPADEAKPGR